MEALSQPELLQGDVPASLSPPPLSPPTIISVLCLQLQVRQEDGALLLLSSIYYRRPLCSSPSNKKRALDARMWHLRSHPPDCNVELFPTGHMRRLINVEPSGGFPSEALTGQPCVPR